MKVDAEMVAAEVLHHIDTMYPKMWEGVPRTARTSVRNCLIREIGNTRNLLPSKEPGIGETVLLKPILGCPHVKLDGWTVDQIHNKVGYSIHHADGSALYVEAEALSPRTTHD